MTRATLLHVLDRPTALGAAEVRELEQLAQAFPYCQTAHLLLAKAAHDHGTMLAGQRLRRAATYAADRTLLRRLIEQVEPAPIEEPLAETTVAEEPAMLLPPAIPATLPPIAAPELLPIQETPTEIAPVAAPIVVPPVVVIEQYQPADPAPVVAILAAPPVAPLLSVPDVAIPLAVPAPEPLAVSPPAEAENPVAIPDATTAAVSAVAEPLPALPDLILIPEAVPEITPAPLEANLPAATTATAEALAIYQATDTETTAVELSPIETAEIALPAASMDVPVAAAEVVTMVAEVLPATTGELVSALPNAALEQVAMEAPATLDEPAAVEEPDLPAQAPASRPPVEVGEARFEFGLAETTPPVAPTYELPGLVDEWAASAVTRSMGSLLPEANLLAPVPAPAVFTPAAFTGDATIGYSFGESSRLGFSMQLLDLLAAKAEAAETATAIVAAAQPPAGPLPPAGTFFEPDPLLLDHWTTHCPPIPVLPSSLDLINNFLKRQPRLTRPAMLPPAPGGQTDLSVRSTRAEPDLVSENLARIFVRQGKIVRAIEIYEKLMVKQPEKMAYFAAQIQSLQPSA